MFSPAAVLRTGYASITGIAVDEAPLPARSSSARSGCYSVNKVLRELSLLANYASLFRATSLRHILDDELQLGPPPAPPPPLTSEESRTAGCVVAFVIAELRAPSRSSTAGGATPHASQSCSREPPPPPLACPPRAAPLSASRPRPRRARSPTPAPRPRQIGSRGRRRGCSSARTSPPTGLEHGREQAQGPRSCTHGRGERPRTWPRDRVSVFCHVLSCLLNTCVHVCMFLPSHSAETVPDEPLPACQPSRIAPLPSASPERTGCARPALSIPSETLPGGRLPANRTRTCARNVGAHQHGARR